MPVDFGDEAVSFLVKLMIFVTVLTIAKMLLRLKRKLVFEMFVVQQ